MYLVSWTNDKGKYNRKEFEIYKEAADFWWNKVFEFGNVQARMLDLDEDDVELSWRIGAGHPSIPLVMMGPK